MIVYEGLRTRADRRAISLPFGDRGGMIISPFAVELDCLYGIDGGTYRLQVRGRLLLIASDCL